MAGSKPQSTRSESRLLGLDQARAVAIIAMIFFHFGEGFFKELPQLQFLKTPVLWFGRMATPAFVVVFGVTVGFVFLPKYIRGDHQSTSIRIWRRAGLILICAVLIAVPEWIRFGTQGAVNPWRWAFAVYSVLLFYAFALALLPSQLRWLARQTEARALVAGAGLWLIGTWGYYAWPAQSPSGPEFVRMMLVSGSYAYVQMIGTGLLAVPLGLQLRRARDAGVDSRFLLRLLIGGLVLSATGAAWGMAVGEYDPSKIVSGELRVPPRAWYFLHFGALALVAISVLEFLSRGVRILQTPGYILALFGQMSLVIFTGHMFVLPTLELIKRVTPLRGPLKVAVAFIPFMIFCAAVIYARHRRVQREAIVRKASEAATPLTVS